MNDLEAPIEIKSTNKRWNSLKENSNKYGVEEYLTQMIFCVLKEIQQIQENIINLNTAISFGISPFIFK